MKTFSFKIDPLTSEEYWEVYLRGQQLMGDPLLNKASAFSEEERLALDLSGLLRTGVSLLDQQVVRALESYQRKPDALEKYIYLLGLLDRSEVLFYRLLLENLAEMVPIVYTPTVGQACLQLSRITRRYRGVYLSPDNIANVDRIFQNISLPAVSLVVVTDGERILGLGDLGSDGMGIPIGKVTLYVAAGGLHPACCLPVTLDVGTDNGRLLDDPLYLGWRHPRLSGPEYEEFVELFILGVRRNFPEALVQWEDFAKHKAFALLERYRDRVPSFNDDIQGTGAVTLATLISAMRIKQERFADQRFVIAGMGQAGTGIAMNIRTALREEGLSDDEIGRRIFAVDQPGLIVNGMAGLSRWQEMVAQDREAVAGWTLASPDRIELADVVRNARATVIVGVTAQRGLFSAEILGMMAGHTDRPVVLSLSNPSSRSECTPEEVARATRGMGLVATGTAFADVNFEGRVISASQCNNMYIFPGVGLGALVSKTPKVTNSMFLAASKALCDQVTAEQRGRGLLLPEMDDIRRVSRIVACAVAKQARREGLGRLLDDETLESLVARAQWVPQYVPYRPGRAAIA